MAPRGHRRCFALCCCLLVVVAMAGSAPWQRDEEAWGLDPPRAAAARRSPRRAKGEDSFSLWDLGRSKHKLDKKAEKAERAQEELRQQLQKKGVTVDLEPAAPLAPLPTWNGTKFIVLTTQRSGSTWACQLLDTQVRHSSFVVRRSSFERRRVARPSASHHEASRMVTRAARDAQAGIACGMREETSVSGRVEEMLIKFSKNRFGNFYQSERPVSNLTFVEVRVREMTRGPWRIASRTNEE